MAILRPHLEAALLLLVLAAVGSSAASARIYHWKDARGLDHFSDRPEDVPPAYRDSAGMPLDVEPELEAKSPFSVLPGLDGPDEGARDGDPHPREDGAFALPGFDAFPDREARAWLERVKGPMILVTGTLFLVMMGLLMAFATLPLLVACRMVGEPSPGFRKAYAIVLLQFVAGMAVAPGVVVVAGGSSLATLGDLLRLQALQLVAYLAVNTAVLRAMLCETVPRALGLAVVTGIVLVLLGIVLGLGLVCAGGTLSLLA